MKNCQVVIMCKECGEVHKQMKEGEKHSGGKENCAVCGSKLEVPKVLVLAPQVVANPPVEDE